MSVEEFVLEQCHTADDEADPALIVLEPTLSSVQALRGLGWQGWHCECSYFRSIFGLLMWDEIYAYVPNVFLSPYQDLPLDFYHASFVYSR
jgi:hypothetical protein